MAMFSRRENFLECFEGLGAVFLCIWASHVSGEVKWKLLLHWEMLEL